MNAVMRDSANYHFSKAPQLETSRSTFNRSHGHKTTFNAGYLIPVLVDEALPGDTFNCKMHAFARLSTQINPIMDNLYLDTFFFAVPYRLVWNNWEKFNGAQDDPDDSTDFTIPVTTGSYVANSLQDYMGIPVGLSTTHANLFPRAYNLIYNTWFRDENLQDSVVVDKGDGPDTASNYALLRRGKRHDYFTSCLPWPQKGPAVTIPLGLTAPVVPDGTIKPKFTDGSGYTTLLGVNATDEYIYSGTPHNYLFVAGQTPPGNTTPYTHTDLYWDTSGLKVDLSSATPASINELREAFQIQHYYERNARGGTRYIEVMKSRFGVTSSDARLQRPEYLGGGSTPINIHAVAQTSGSGISGEDTPLANLGAYGTVSLHDHGFVKSFEEHCLIIGIVSVRADYTYQQGIERMWKRSTIFDFYLPEFSHIGEQSVYNYEIYLQVDGTAANTETFGYQERYAEYRYKPSRISGEFRSSFPQSLDVWHLSQEFGSLPVLNDEFIVENPPMSRIKAVETEPDFLFDSWFNMQCARPMPVYAVPSLIDHF